MTIQVIDVTTPQPNGRFGEPNKTAFQKVNANDAELDGRVTTAQTTAANALPRAGGRVTGELLVGGAGGLRLVADGVNVYYDARANVVSSTVPDGNAYYRAETHRWTNSSGVTVATLTGLGGLTIGSTFNCTSEIRTQGTTAGLGFDDRNDTNKRWSLYANAGICRLWAVGQGDRFWVNEAGQAFATGFNPTSSADVKDYIEGYAGDAETELNRMVVIEYNYRPEFSDPNIRVVGLLAENVADVHPSASGEERVTHVQVEVERDVEVEYPVKTIRQVEVLTPVADFDTTDPQYTSHFEEQEVTAFVKRWEKRMVPEMVESKQPRTVDIMQVLALSVRAHQQKSRTISQLQASLAEAEERITALEQNAMSREVAYANALASVMNRIDALEAQAGE